MSTLSKEALFEISQGFAAHLKFLSELGCPGLACSEKTIQTINGWGLTPGEKSSSKTGRAAAFSKCRDCSLSLSRQPMVLGVGASGARLAIVGGAASPEDEKAGKPYAGRAGELLNKMLEAMGLSRDQVYITRAVKCCPAEGRSPALTDVNRCRSHLLKELGMVKPEVVCAFGDVAAVALLETSTPLSRLRGRFHALRDIKIMPTYAPEHLLLHPEVKREVWEDLKQIMAALAK